MMQGEKVAFGSEAEMASLSDYAIHEIRHNGRNAFDRLLADDPPTEGSPEMRFLLSTRQAHFSVFRVLERLPGVGAKMIDIFREVEMTVVDMVHSPSPGWWMTTGGGLPVTDEAMVEIQKAVRIHHQLHGGDPKTSELSVLVTRACVKAKAGDQMRFIDAGGPETNSAATNVRATAPIRTGPKVGRNDPCPCGSGKKFKKCCG
jgi:hypothetical protein